MFALVAGSSQLSNDATSSSPSNVPSATSTRVAPSPDNPGSSGVSVGAVVGAAIGVAAAVLIALVAGTL